MECFEICNVFDIVENFNNVNIKPEILVQKIKVKKMFFIYHFSRLSLIIKLFIPLDREMY